MVNQATFSCALHVGMQLVLSHSCDDQVGTYVCVHVCVNL